MALVFPVDPNQSFETRRGDIERVRDASAQYFKVHGEIEVSSIGEALVRVKFPIRFCQKPVFHAGGELAPGFASAVPGSFPTYSLTILTWDYKVKTDGSFLYVGALFGIVTGGIVNQVMNIHWSVEGVGLRNPSGQ